MPVRYDLSHVEALHPSPTLGKDRFAPVLLAALALLFPAAQPAPGTEPSTLVSRAEPGQLNDTCERGGGASNYSGRTISADGRYVVFHSDSGNLVDDDSPLNRRDVFLLDRDTGGLTLVSHAAGLPGIASDNDSSDAAISADGQWVAYGSYAENLVAGQVDSGGTDADLFLWDRLADVAEIVTHVPGDPLAARNSGSPALRGLSADGSKLLLTSASPDLVASQVDANGLDDLFVFDRATGTVSLVTHIAGFSANVAAGTPVANSALLAESGLWVAFRSDGATNLVAGSTVCATGEAFLYDVAAGTNRIVSHAPGTPLVGASAGGCGSRPLSISADGQYVAFNCPATNCVAGQTDSNGGPDVFLYDRTLDATALVSRASGTATTTANAPSVGGTISANGAVVAFSSPATNLAAGLSDGFGTWDLFAWNSGTGAVTLVSHAQASATTTASGLTFWSPRDSYSANGGVLLYESLATNLVAGQVDLPNTYDLFAWSSATNSNELVNASAASASTPGDAESALTPPGLADDGTTAIFTSVAGDLLDPLIDRNDSADVFARELGGGPTAAVTRRDPALPAAGVGTFDPFLGMFATPRASGDGRYVAFTSRGGNLVSNQFDRNRSVDVFLYDRVTGNVTLVSHASSDPDRTGNADSFSPAISEDGNWVAFRSLASDLAISTTDSNFDYDIFLWERNTGTATLVSHAAGSPGMAGDAGATGFGPWISADGSRVAFESSATDLVSGQIDVPGSADVFVYDRSAGTSTLASHATSGPANTTGQPSQLWQISLDGDWVIFGSSATNVVAGQSDVNGDADLFLHEVGTGANLLVSRSSAGATSTGDGFAGFGRLSRDGRYVAFASAATNLVAGQADANADFDVFLFDRVGGSTQLASSTAPGSTVTGNAFSEQPELSPDGRFVAFATYATNLAAGVVDAGTGEDTYRWDRTDGSRRLVSHTGGSTTTAAEGVFPYALAISDRGSSVLFMSAATSMVPLLSDANENVDVFRWDSGTGWIELVSRMSGSENQTGNRGSFDSQLSLLGEMATFTSASSDLVAADNNDDTDLFVARPDAIFSDGFEEGDPGAWN